MGAHIHAAANGFNRSLITLFISFFRIHALRRKFTECIACIGQRNGFPAGNGNLTGRKIALGILHNAALFRSQRNAAAAGINTVRILAQLPGGQRMMQRDAFFSGNRNIACSGIYRAGNNDCLRRFQFHVFASIDLAGDRRFDYLSVLILFFQL